VDPETGRRFVKTMRSWLITLPHDLKILYEASSDENLQREARELAIGAIIYTVSPNDFISTDRQDFTSYADDCIMLRLALRRIIADDGEDADFFKSRFAEFFAKLDEELGVCAEAMGEIFSWLDSKVDGLKLLEYKGKKVPQYLDDDEAGEFLYEDGLGFATEYPVDEDELIDKFKKASTILEVLQRRKVEDDRSASKG
jgi:uncharacterized membrane protein YkvA (DUF1232 family)